MMHNISKGLGLILAFCLFAGAVCPGIAAAEISQTEATTMETVSTAPTEPQVTAPAAETEEAPIPEETEAMPETTEAPVPAATPETLPLETLLPEETETVPATESPLATEEDEWLFTLTDTPPVTDPPPVEVPPEPPEDTLVSRLAKNWESLLAALVFALFGTGTCWFGIRMGGLKFLLRFRGIPAEATVSRVQWDAWHGSHLCFLSYRLENGRTVETPWPVRQHILQPEKLRGRTCTVYYNPRNPKEFHCTLFPMGSFLGSISVAVGALLLAAAAAVVGCVIFI